MHYWMQKETSRLALEPLLPYLVKRCVLLLNYVSKRLKNPNLGTHKHIVDETIIFLSKIIVFS